MSDSVRPHRRQPTRLRRPWESPGKNTGVGCCFLLHYWSIVDLQCWVSFRCTAKWGSYVYTCIYSFFSLFPYRPLQSTEQSSLGYIVGPCYLSILYIVVCMSVPISQFIPLSIPGNQSLFSTSETLPPKALTWKEREIWECGVWDNSPPPMKIESKLCLFAD